MSHDGGTAVPCKHFSNLSPQSAPSENCLRTRTTGVWLPVVSRITQVRDGYPFFCSTFPHRPPKSHSGGMVAACEHSLWTFASPHVFRPSCRVPLFSVIVASTPNVWEFFRKGRVATGRHSGRRDGEVSARSSTQLPLLSPAYLRPLRARR